MLISGNIWNTLSYGKKLVGESIASWWETAGESGHFNLYQVKYRTAASDLVNLFHLV